MKKYKVLVSTTLSEEIEIEANNKKEAIELAKEQGVSYDTEDIETRAEILD